MPTIIPNDKVLVTGANGYIAIWVVRGFLEKGYAVRGTVRSADKGNYLTETFKSYGDKFEVVVVGDFTKEGAFDEAVKNVDAIAHTASPFYLDADDPQELIGPAVKGTVGILQSALKHGNSIKRIVVTSSCASVLQPGVNRVFSELDWNEGSIEEVNQLGAKASGITKYRASKTLAERAAWDFYAANKSKLLWELVVLNPPFVFGPLIHEVKTFSALNSSSRQWFDAVLKGTKTNEALITEGSAWVDVRDLAEAHVRSLEKEAAGGERIIPSAGSFVWQEWLDAANSLSPSPIPSHTPLPVGAPKAGRPTLKYPLQYSTEKEAKILGLKYHTLEETTRDTLADFENRGF